MKAVKSFTGRIEELKRAKELLLENGTVLIKGEMGSGRSEFAYKFSEDNLESYDIVIYLKNFDSVYYHYFVQLSDLFTEIQPPPPDYSIVPYLQKLQKWLIIIAPMDTCTNRDFIRDQLVQLTTLIDPAQYRHIMYLEELTVGIPIFTQTIELMGLPETDSLDLFKKVGGDHFKNHYDDATLLTLVGLSEGFPIVIQSLCKFILANKIEGKDIQTTLLDQLTEKSNHNDVFQSLMSLIAKKLKSEADFPLDLYGTCLYLDGSSDILDKFFDDVNTQVFKYPLGSVQRLLTSLKTYGIIDNVSGNRKYLLTLRHLENKKEQDTFILSFAYNSLAVGCVNTEPHGLMSVYRHIIHFLSNEFDLSIHISHLTLLTISASEFMGNVYQNSEESFFFADRAVQFLQSAPESDIFAMGLRFRAYKQIGILHATKEPADNEQSYKYLKESYKIFKNIVKSTPKADPSYKLLIEEEPFILLNLGLCLVHRDKVEKGISIFEKIIEIIPDKEKSEDYTKALNNLGFAYCKLKDYSKGIYYYRQSLSSIQLKQLTPVNFNLLATYRNLAIAYIHIGDVKKANENMEIIYKTLKKSNPKELIYQTKIDYEKEVSLIQEEQKQEKMILVVKTSKYLVLSSILLGIGFVALKYFKK